MNYQAEKERFTHLYESLLENGQLINLGQILYRAAQKYPQKTVLISTARTMNFQELFYRASLFANQVQKHGIKPGDRVLLFFENSIEFFIGYYGIAQTGAVVTPLNTFLTEHELRHIIGDAQPALLVASTPLLEKLAAVELINGIPLLTENDMDVTSAVDMAACQPVPRLLESEQMAALLYTSGTTGLPKGVMLSSRNILVNCAQGIARIGFVHDERVFGVLPFFHSFAQQTCVWGTVLLGCSVIIVPKVERRAIIEGLSHRPTFFMGVPALFGLLCLLRIADVEHVDYFVSGGDALPDKIRAAFELIYQRKICDGYGLSEASPVVCTDLDDVLRPTNSVGRPVYHEELEIRDEKGESLPAQMIGEIWVKGPNVMLGYYKEPQKTADVIHDGWLDTGDLGYLDDSGKLVITGRLKDIIINKGFKIYPQEIENVILMHPAALRAGVVGQADPAAGEIVVAYVQLKAEHPGIEKALQELCERHLAAYKVPRKFICSVEALPITATGKVDKKVLRKKSASHE